MSLAPQLAWGGPIHCELPHIGGEKLRATECGRSGLMVGDARKQCRLRIQPLNLAFDHRNARHSRACARANPGPTENLIVFRRLGIFWKYRPRFRSGRQERTSARAAKARPGYAIEHDPNRRQPRRPRLAPEAPRSSAPRWRHVRGEPSCAPPRPATAC